jgi:hypothetical protein
MLPFSPLGVGIHCIQLLMDQDGKGKFAFDKKIVPFFPKKTFYLTSFTKSIPGSAKCPVFYFIKCQVKAKRNSRWRPINSI